MSPAAYASASAAAMLQHQLQNQLLPQLAWQWTPLRVSCARASGRSLYPRRRPWAPTMAAAAAAVDENGGVGAAAIDVLMRGTPRLDAILRSGLGFRNRDLEKISKHKVCEALEKDLRSVGKGGLSSRTEDRLWGLFTCFREDLDVSTEVIRRMVLEYPQLLMLSESAPADTVHMLASDCGLKTSVALDLIAAIPALLTLKTAPRRKVAYLAAEVGLSPLSIAAMTAAQPAIFGQSLDGHLRPAISFFTSHLGLELSAVRAMVVRQPRLLSMSIENNLKPKVEYLMNEVGMSLPQVAKALASHPAVLCLSLDDNIAPTVGWLRAPTQREVEDGASPPDKGYVRMYPEGGLGLSREDTALLLSRQADVLCKSVTLNLKLKAEYFRQLGLTDEQLRQAVTRHPALLCLSVEHNIAPKIAFLQSEMALSSGGIAQLVAMHGNILTLSLTTNLRPKLGLFHDELGAQPDELAKVLMTNPRLLTASVERRILPRMAAMSARGLTPQFPHIRPITVYTDIMFERWLNSIAPAKPALAVAEGLEIGLEVASSNPNIMGGRLVFPSTLEPPTPDTDQLAIRGALSDNLAAPAVPSMIPFAATADGTGRRSGGRIRMLDALQPASKHSVGASVQETTAELGLKYLIPTPGASGRGPPRLPFLPGRQAARETARDLARNLRCLDLYSGTGGFALNCALGGASEVVAVEKAAWPSAAALSNARMNKLTPRWVPTMFEIQYLAYVQQRVAAVYPTYPSSTLCQTNVISVELK
eukprot:TRINITY_DN8835_c0_g1_i2.p1 TRINITY_DN8835_c0_g1~~TRINITY_DN8835_c0_g1_i2.p1  ORF type:complete len:760 (-),score=173.98 TRINITY_DN8835_c0_g1_i2:2544-4823(-)